MLKEFKESMRTIVNISKKLESVEKKKKKQSNTNSVVPKYCTQNKERTRETQLHF